MKSSDLYREYLMPAVTAAMQTCWLYPWALLIGSWVQVSAGQSLLSPAVIFILLMAARLAARGLMGRDLPIEQVRTDLVALGLFAAVIAVRIDHYPATSVLDLSWLAALIDDLANVVTRPSLPIFGAAFALFLWWQGIVQERDRVSQENTEDAFRNGAIALVLFLLVAAMTGFADANALKAQIGVYVVTFFFLGLTALSVAHLETIREQARARGDNSLPFNRHWPGMVLSIVAAMLLITLALAQILSLDLIGMLFAPLLDLAGMVLRALIYVIVVPLFFVVDEVGKFILSLLHLQKNAMQFKMPDMSNLNKLNKNQTPAGFPPELILAAKWAIVAITCIAGIALLVRSIFRGRDTEASDDVEEERDSVWDEASLRAAILAWLSSLWRRWFQRKAQVSSVAVAQAARQETGSPLAVTIREVYRQLLAFGARVGASRPAGATPYEHLPRLQEHLTPSEDLAVITEAYVRTRYGPDEPSEDDAREVRDRWARIKEPESLDRNYS